MAGLAPARVGLKIRARELLCIHGLLAEARMAPEVGIAPTSPRLQRGANLSQLPRVRRSPAEQDYGANDLLNFALACRAEAH